MCLRKPAYVLSPRYIMLCLSHLNSSTHDIGGAFSVCAESRLRNDGRVRGAHADVTVTGQGVGRTGRGGRVEWKGGRVAQKVIGRKVFEIDY
jgi:hypothetical protein